MSVNRSRRIRSMHTARQPSRTSRRPPTSPAAEETALAFLSEILIGDRAWTIAEVRRMISMRESAELGRWSVTGSDDEGASAV
jgi:hypothetical protein